MKKAVYGGMSKVRHVDFLVAIVIAFLQVFSERCNLYSETVSDEGCGFVVRGKISNDRV